MNIAVLGGCFDPPHFGHLWVAQQVLEHRSDIQQVWLIPAAKHQWKPINASADDRCQMLKSFEGKDIKISDIELKRGGISYTIDTIQDIKNSYGHSVYWIVGSDIIPEFPRWDRTEELTKLATFLVFPRDPHTIPDVLPRGFEALREKDLLVTNLSSTAIRKRVKEGKSIKGFVPEQIETYIKTNKLYI
jgi:nicotinate-nucleotide adenylyltransferase